MCTLETKHVRTRLQFKKHQNSKFHGYISTVTTEDPHLFTASWCNSIPPPVEVSKTPHRNIPANPRPIAQIIESTEQFSLLRCDPITYTFHMWQLILV